MQKDICKTGWRGYCFFVLLPISEADIERVINYEYDTAGNLVEIAPARRHVADCLEYIAGYPRIGPPVKINAQETKRYAVS